MTSIKLQTDLGPLWYPDGDGGVTAIVQNTGQWEPAESAAIRRILKPGDTFVDVGAHVGYFSVLAAQIVGEEGSVLAFEPIWENATLLSRNLEQFTNCVMFQTAAWFESGQLQMYPSTVNSGDNRVFDHPESAVSVSVPAIPLDSLYLQQVDLIKIDTQGADHMVVHGALQTLERCRPHLIVEWWPEGMRGYGADPTKVLDQYEQLGYRVTALTEDAVIPDNDYCSLLLEPVAQNA